MSVLGRFLSISLRSFKITSSNLFDEADERRGYFVVESREGKIRSFPTSIFVTASVVLVRKGRFSSYIELTDALIELKNFGKKKEGSVIVFDRRQRSFNGLVDRTSEGPLLSTGAKN
jgi:hypothetical protein